MQIYIVGGSVRDNILEINSKDTDFVVIGSNEKEFLSRFPKAKKVGTRKCVYILRGKEYTLSESKDIYEDLKVRDLTINAFAKDESGRIYGLPESFEDINNKILRPVSEKNFFDDPLRVFRAARFASVFPEFTFHSYLYEVMEAVGKSGLMHNISAERVGNECLKACNGKNPGRFLELLSKTGCLYPWLKEFQNAHKIPAGPVPYHFGSVLDHIIEVMNELKGSEIEVWMGLCHDIGKTITDENIWPHHFDHDNKGEPLALELGERLKLPTKFIRAGAIAAKFHMKAGNYNKLSISKKIDLILTLNKINLLKELFNFVKADKRIDFYPEALQHLNTVLSVSLPDDKKNLGVKSGEILHSIRCHKLKSTIKK
ncbi:MAG: hypothetical protein HQK76_12645 [Desulfobacterales bacterium]|nr:hypothetical protein [Desulfobacterales bacterium]